MRPLSSILSCVIYAAAGATGLAALGINVGVSLRRGGWVE